MKNREIAELLTKMGTLLEIRGDLVFKVRAYYKAAENINALAEDIAVVEQENRLADIPGVGKTMQEKIKEFLETGSLSSYEKLIKDVPETVLDVIHIPSVGPKKAKLFFDELKVKDIPSLKKAAESGKLLDLPGIKEKTVTNILDGIKIVEQGQQRMNLGKASRVAETFIEELKKLKAVKQINPAGSLRRGRETIRDIDLLIDSKDPKAIMDVFVHLPQVKSINAYGDTKSSILTTDNVQVDLRVVDTKSYGAALLYFTGSKNFNIKLRQAAIKKGMKINEYGVFKVNDRKEQCVASKTEKECLEAFDLPYVPPELREDIGEKDIFSGKKLPELIELKDLKGDFHVHSTWSDGKNSIEEMAEAARQRGFSYLAISDHSQKLRIARGVSPEDLKKKKKEIDALNKKYSNFRILFGTELEIDAEGNLDYNDKILSEFDIVIASIHTGFEQGSKTLTKRLMRAMQSKYVNIIAHPMGGHIGKREPYEVDFKAVCQAAVDHNVFLEINAFPVRLDLNSQNVYYARSQGVKFTINTDSHNVSHMDYMKLGVSIARRGWLTKKDVLNTQTLAQVMKSIKK
ncbi:MAG: DNA polymerase/3'-5' exonuclease PolX [Candidatus Omnitrophica bacterium]|nr:DNA polymerase/3'-5' exonuclease PolX [Candidatus Omnitrophota bacterium]